MVDTIKFKTTLYKDYNSKPSIANHKVYTHSQVKVGRGSRWCGSHERYQTYRVCFG